MSEDFIGDQANDQTRYHWALLVGPKNDRDDVQGVRYHAREQMSQGGSTWIFEEKKVRMMPIEMILVRIVLAKIENRVNLAQVLRQVPVRQREEGWNCVSWVKEALLRVEQSTGVIGTSVVDWKAVRDADMSFCQQKRDQHRFDGTGDFDNNRVPTFDLIKGKETTA